MIIYIRLNNSILESEDKIRENERIKIGEHLHDVISNELLYLQFLILKLEDEINKESFSKIITELDFIRTQVRNISHKIVSPKVDTNLDLIQSIKEVLIDYTFLFPNTIINYNVFPKNLSLSFDYNKQKEILIIIKELIQNSLQHGKPENIDFGITEFENELNILIEDNGFGFDTNKKNKGIGLTNCNNRIKKMKGTIAVESNIGKGTIININLNK